MNHCRGCFSLSDDDDQSCNGKYNIGGICPCSYCLIKSMCQVECSKYEEFAEYMTGLMVKSSEAEILRNEK